jgi:predicted O-methyltransferase YrrM
MNSPEVVPTNQAWSNRVEVMADAISNFEGPIDMLEVGTWFGEGSTKIWLDNLKPGSTLTLVDPWRPYASEADLRDQSFNYGSMDAQVLEAYLSTILAMRRFENAHPGKIKVDILRADSERLLARMRDDQFDFIYIDGDHKYESVKRNIQDAKRLAKRSFSIVCGDDLEVLPTPEILELARHHRDRDHLRPENHSVFHPGVVLAVHEEFEQVGMHNGFWWVVQRNGRFSIDGRQ